MVPTLVQGDALSSTSLYFEKYFFPHKKYLLQVPSNLQLLLLLLLQMWLLLLSLFYYYFYLLQLLLAPLLAGGPSLAFHFICFAFAALSLSTSLSSLNYSLAALGSSRPTRSHAESTIANPFLFLGAFFLSVCVCVCVFVLLLLPFSWRWVLNTTFEEEELELLLLLS